MNITEILEDYKDVKFSWGTMDCCIFVGEIAEKITKKPLYKSDWKKVLTYTTAKGSIKAVKALGGKEIVDLPTQVLGVSKRDISTVKHGDIVYIIDDNGDSVLGVCNGVRAYFLAKPKGLIATPIKNCLYCWSPK